MRLFLKNEEFRILHELIVRECGLAIDKNQPYIIEDRLADLVSESGCSSYRDFCEILKNDTSGKTQGKIIEAMTTGETSWFRDDWPFTILAEKLLPKLAKRPLMQKSLRILSAGCSTGQEPYSIAITTIEQCHRTDDNLCIVAIDISNPLLTWAKIGRFRDIELTRGLGDEYRKRYFYRHKRVFAIQERVKNCVEFKQINLKDSLSGLGLFDIVFLRNVALYYSVEFRRRLFAKIAKIINPGGYLFLGTTEFLQGISENFEMIEDKALYYRLKPQRG